VNPADLQLAIPTPVPGHSPSSIINLADLQAAVHAPVSVHPPPPMQKSDHNRPMDSVDPESSSGGKGSQNPNRKKPGNKKDTNKEVQKPPTGSQYYVLVGNTFIDYLTITALEVGLTFFLDFL